MTAAPIADLVAAVRPLHLLVPAQEEQAAALRPQFPEAQALARELLRRGWLTAYQVNQVFQGRGEQLLLGSYVLLERLGEGGMGQVFKARNWKLGRVVALKVIRREFLTDPEVVQRFRREIRAVAQLGHPNIVLAHDADEVGGTHFLVMEFVEGTDLGRLVERRGPLPVDEACDFARQAALGLQHACERGLVHRDIKPSNLLLTAPAAGSGAGVVKIVDFGLARLAPGMDLTTTLTPANGVMGTPDFMAPEQALGSHDVDIRADLYSLGCTLYWLLTGQVPFPGGTLGQKIARHLNQEAVPVERLRPGVPPAVAAVVGKLMAKLPEDRYQTPAGLAAVLQCGLPAPGEALAEAVLASTRLTGPSAETVPPPRRIVCPPGASSRALASRRRLTRRALLAGAAGALLLGGAGGTLYWVSRQEGAAPFVADDTPPGTAGSRARRRLLLTELDRAEVEPEDLEAAGLGDEKPPPEGLAAVLGDRRQSDAPFFAVAWSPDGKLLAAAGDDGTIRLWHTVQGGTPRLLQGHVGRVCSLSFSRDSHMLASGGVDSWVRVWDCEKAKLRFSFGGMQGHKHQVRTVAWSPIESRLVSGSLDKTVKLWNAAQGSLLETLDGGSESVEAVAFAPDGHVFASGCFDGEVRVWDAEPRRYRGSLPRQGRGVGRLAFSGDGRWIAVASFGGKLLLWERDGNREAGAWSAHSGVIMGLAFRPDGNLLATAGGDGMVRLWNPATCGKSREIAVGPAGDAVQRGSWLGHVAFSPDGRYLATANANGTVYILRL
jgi:serine/threonine protein kinase